MGLICKSPQLPGPGDAEFLRSVKTKYPGGFDILLDDGSHLPEHQFTTFVHLWSAIRPGGVLMIEDVHGINPMFKWLMEGHMNENAKMPGWLGGFKMFQEISRIRLSCHIPTHPSNKKPANPRLR